MGGLSWQHLLIVLIIVLVLFGGSRIAGLGKSTGRALREFKEETKGLAGGKDDAAEPGRITAQDEVRRVEETQRAEDVHRAEDIRRADGAATAPDATRRDV